MVVYELPTVEGSVLYLQPEPDPYRAPSGPLTVIRENEPPTQQWHLPEMASALVTRTQVYEEIRDALESVHLSKQARTAVEKMLDGLPG